MGQVGVDSGSKSMNRCIACQHIFKVHVGSHLHFALCVIHPFQSDVVTFLVVHTVPADRSNLTIRTDQILDFSHVLCEAHILKSVHVVHKPVGGQSVPVHRALCGGAAEAALFPHGW